MSDRRKEQERWIQRYVGHFGEPSKLQDFRDGKATFRELYDSALQSAEWMLAEAQSVKSIAFED